MSGMPKVLNFTEDVPNPQELIRLLRVPISRKDRFIIWCSHIYEYIVVYDPSGGFVTGDGWIDSPEGAYTPDESLTGKANFGFVSKYKKGAYIPTGQTEFKFKAGDLNFHSSSYEWLVVTGSDYARFKGAGTINGGGDYKFMLWAGDGEPDTFRIKTWTEDFDGTETVIYDNGFDQEIGGGSIVVNEMCQVFGILEEDLKTRKIPFKQANLLLEAHMWEKEFGVDRFSELSGLSRIYRSLENREQHNAFIKEIQNLNKPVLEAREKHLEELRLLLTSWQKEIHNSEFNQLDKITSKIETHSLFESIMAHCYDVANSWMSFILQYRKYRFIEEELAAMISVKIPKGATENFATSVIRCAMGLATSRTLSEYQKGVQETESLLVINQNEQNLIIWKGDQTRLSQCQELHKELIIEFENDRRVYDLVLIKDKIITEKRALSQEITRTLGKRKYAKDWCTNCVSWPM